MSDPAPHHSFPWRITAVVAAVIIVATVAAGLLLARDRVAPSPEPAATASLPSAAVSPSASPEPLEDSRQLTMLLTVRDADRAAVSNVLIGFGGGTQAVSELVLPRDLLLPTVPPRRLAAVDDPTGPQTAEQPLETLLGVQVDALLDLDRLAWRGLIDANGSRVNLTAADQPGAFVLAVDRVLKGLPYDEQTAGQLLTGLGSMARTTVTNEDAGYLLSRLGRAMRTLPVDRRLLPVTYLRSGPARVAVADQAAVTPMVTEMFPEALLRPGHPGQRRAVLQRAGATVGALAAARLDLQAAGFGVVVDPVEQELAATTSIVVPDGSSASTAAGASAAAALGLPATAVVVATGDGGTVDVRVVLGPDATARAR